MMSQITTHILDTSRGKPASDVSVKLYQRKDSREMPESWLTIGQGITDSDGRIAELLPREGALAAGTYKLRFNTKAYFDHFDSPYFYPFIEIVFEIEGDGQHYHVPLLLNPYGFSTYRGS